MRKVFVTYEILLSQPSDGVYKTSKPDFVFQGEFDKDDDVSFSKLCDLEYKVEKLADAFKSLDCDISVVKKELSHLKI